MVITVCKDEGEEVSAFTILINGVNFNKLLQAPSRERQPLARSKTSINMSGIKKHGYYPLLRNGELIPVTVLLNKQTNFAKLQVGKQIITARQKQGSQKSFFPQSIAVVGLAPLEKVWVDYLPQPQNEFIIKINGNDYYILPKEDLDFDPS